MHESTKICPTCREVKPHSEFGKNKARKDGMSFYCRACGRVRNQEWRDTQPDYREKNRVRMAEIYADRDRYLNYRYRNMFGITLAQYEEMLATQGGGCAICGHVPSDGEPRLAVDHDHGCCPAEKKSCGKCVRGLLCGSCNRGLGYFQDDSSRMAKAIEYLSSN